MVKLRCKSGGCEQAGYLFVVSLHLSVLFRGMRVDLWGGEGEDVQQRGCDSTENRTGPVNLQIKRVH